MSSLRSCALQPCVHLGVTLKIALLQQVGTIIGWFPKIAKATVSLLGKQNKTSFILALQNSVLKFLTRANLGERN